MKKILFASILLVGCTKEIKTNVGIESEYNKTIIRIDSFHHSQDSIAKIKSIKDSIYTAYANEITYLGSDLMLDSSTEMYGLSIDGWRLVLLYNKTGDEKYIREHEKMRKKVRSYFNRFEMNKRHADSLKNAWENFK